MRIYNARALKSQKSALKIQKRVKKQMTLKFQRLKTLEIQKTKQRLEALKPYHFILVFLALFVSNLRALTSFELHNIDKAHEQGYTGKGVNIGIVDSIFNPNHELLFGKFLEPPINNTYSEPTNNHGNHIAGIAAAARTDGANYGVAYNSKIVAYGNLGMSNYSTGFGAMLTHNVRVINNSHTAFYPQFVEFARQNNSILIVYASGNDGALTPTLAAKHGTGSAKSGGSDVSFPDTYYNLGAWLTVGNIDSSYVKRKNDGSLEVLARAVGGKSASTNLCQGARAYCVMAAGTDILSAGYANGSLYQGTGTSQAAPAVSGVAALLAEKFPFLNGKQLADFILTTANKDFTAPKVIYKYNTNTGLYDIIYIDSEIPKIGGTNDKAQILKDLRAAYVIFTEDNYKNANVIKMSKDEVFGQGIVDAAAALRGLAMIDINRLGESDIKTFNGTQAAFYTLDTKGHNALFENDISQRTWDAKYQNSSVQAQLGVKMKNLNAGLIKTGAGTLSISGNLNYLGDTIVENGELRLLGKGAKMQAMSENSAQISSQNLSQSVNLNANFEQNSAKNSNQNAQINFNSITGQIFNELSNPNSAKISSQNLAQNVNPPPPASFFSSAPNSLQISRQNSNALSVAGSVLVRTQGILSTSENVSIAKNLDNEGVVNVGLNAPSLLSVGGKYSQKQNATLKLSFFADTGANSALKATTYDIKGGALIYKPLSASIAERTLVLNLQGLEKQLANFTTITLDNSGYALKYELLGDNKTLRISGKPNAYADFDGANESLASVLRAMSGANINDAYQNFFRTLNDMNFNDYKTTLQSLDEKANLEQNEQILLSQSKNTLENVLELQNASTQWLLKPHFSVIKSKDTNANRIGTSIYANKINPLSTFSAFLHYDTLLNKASQKVNSQSLSVGVGAKQAMQGFGLFGGASVGGALNSVKTESNIRYNALFANAWAGADTELALYGAKLVPTAFVSYHLFHQGKIDESKMLFARQIAPTNTHFVSANAGVNLRQNLNKALNASAYGFYERRIFGKEFQNEAEFKDFSGKFTQKRALGVDFARVGLNLNYEQKQRRVARVPKTRRVGKMRHITYSTQTTYRTRYFLSLGFESEFSLNDDEYKGFGANLKAGLNF